MQTNEVTQPQTPAPSFIGRAIVLALVLLFVLLLRTPMSWTDQAILGGILVACCVVMGRLSDSRFVTSSIAMISVFCTLRYIIWRWSSSIEYLNNSGWNVDKVGLISALVLLCAESYAVGILLLGYFQSARPLKRLPTPMPVNTDEWPSVDVFIPTYNEPLEVVRPTVLAAMGIDWPPDRLNVYILDDGRRQQFKEFAAQCGAGYLTRQDNFHAKAGNINAALEKTKGDYIAIFDCDHIATRSFLQLTMGWFFNDDRLAMVQTPHHFYSPDPFERNLDTFRSIPNEGALFYGVVQDGNDLWNATFFCGSCAVIKRDALEEIGGIAVETVTEDAHTALRLQRKGWNTAYIGIPQAAGLATGSLAAHVGQRIRWARGMVQILRTEFPLFASGLSLPQRLCYLNCAVHYLYAIPRLIFVSAPLVYLLLGRSNLYGLIWEILAYAAPHLILCNIVNSRSQGDHRHSFWNEVYEMVLAPYILLPTTLALINPKWGKFNVTSKDSIVEEGFFDWRIARPYLFLIALNLAAIIVAVPRYFLSGDSAGVLFVNVLWAVLNTLLLGACIAVSFENKQRRSAVRVQTNLTASLTLASDDVYHCHVLDISEGGLALRSDRLFDCRPGQSGKITIHAGDDESAFNVDTVRINDTRIHLRFADISLPQQRAITRILYTRADSWVDWTKDQKRDRILTSLVNVFGIGAKGVWMLPSLLVRRPAKKKPAVRKPAFPKAALPPTILILGLLLPFFHSKAQQVDTPKEISLVPPSDSAPQPKSENTFRDTQSFADLGYNTPLTLRGDKAKASLNVILPGTKIVNLAKLNLRYVAGEINPGVTVDLVARLNDIEIGRTTISHPSAAPVGVQFSVPADLLVHENALSFELHLACSVPCSSRAAADPWIRLESFSELATSGVVLEVPKLLSMLPAPFFDSSLPHSTTVPVVFETEPDIATLKAAGVIASWYGALAGYRGSHFATSIGLFPKGNVIFFGSSGGSLVTQLGLAVATTEQTPVQVAICDNPSDPYGKVLALIAGSGADLVRLSQFVTHYRFTEDSDRLSVSSDLLVDPHASAAAPAWFETDRPLHLVKSANENPLRAKIGSPASLYFRLAPDLDYGLKRSVPLHLAFRLNGLSGEDHVWLSIRLNNAFVTKCRLGAAEVENNQMQSFAVPVSLLYSSNTLNIELSTDRFDTNVSYPATVDLQILPATSLDLQNPAHLVRMPRLDLFAAAGYPFTSRLDGSDTAVTLPENATAAQIGLFLDAAAFLGAQTGVAAVNFEVLNPKDLAAGNGRNLLVIGSSNDEDSFRRFERSMIILPVNSKFTLSDQSPPWNDWLSFAFLNRNETSRSLLEILEQEVSSRFLIEEFASPFRQDRSVVVFATRSEVDSEPYLERLAEASKRGAIHGGVSVADNQTFTSFNLISGSYALGQIKSLEGGYDWLRSHLWFLAFLIVALSLILAASWEKLLDRQAKKRLFTIPRRNLLLKAVL